MLDRLKKELLRIPQRPLGKADVVLDTDMYNEVDDQFALSYLLGSGDKLDLKAVYAAPFFNEKSTGPLEGMEKSYHEIFKILSLAGRSDLEKMFFEDLLSTIPQSWSRWNLKRPGISLSGRCSIRSNLPFTLWLSAPLPIYRPLC